MKFICLVLRLMFVLTLGFQADAFPATPAPAAPAVKDLVDKYGCMSCHGLVHTQVGPGFAMVAGRYQGKPDASTYLAGRIRNGAVGNWGRLVMPQQPHMTEAESLQLAQWVLARPGS